jgi:hypothetical protein
VTSHRIQRGWKVTLAVRQQHRDYDVEWAETVSFSEAPTRDAADRVATWKVEAGSQNRVRYVMTTVPEWRPEFQYFKKTDTWFSWSEELSRGGYSSPWLSMPGRPLMELEEASRVGAIVYYVRTASEDEEEDIEPG